MESKHQLPALKTAAASVLSSAKPAAPSSTTNETAFQLIVSGQIVSVAFPGVGNLYCRYAVTYGTDWRVVHGADAGLTQLAYRSTHDGTIVFNFPIDISFKSTNPFGWPRIVFSVYGLDGFGRDIVRGYGSMHIPTCACRMTRTPPEYFDAKFITQNDGREVTRVTSSGKIKVTLNVATSGMRQHGYSTDAAYA